MPTNPLRIRSNVKSISPPNPDDANLVSSNGTSVAGTPLVCHPVGDHLDNAEPLY